MRTLADTLAALGEHPRAVPWRIRLHQRWGTASSPREFVVFAPALGRSVWPVLARAHNAALLFNPAAVEVVVPMPEADLEPVLGRVRSVHKVPIFVAPAKVESRRELDVPSVERPALEPPGPGLAVGLDIGGTGMKAVAMQRQAVVASASAVTWPAGEFGIDSLIRRGRALILEVAGGEPIGSLGIGLAAPLGVGGQVLELSTILRERVGDANAFEGFSERISEGIVQGPVAMFNDLSNLGRHLSAEGARRLVRVQMGTSFGGCWIDADGEVVATEMGRLVVDLSPDATPHTYLPIAGAMRTYLSNMGVGLALAAVGIEAPASRSGHQLRTLLEAGDPRATAVLEHLGAVMVGVVQEFATLLVGIESVECGGSMLQGPAGALLQAWVAPRAPLPFRVSPRPGEDGAIAAALAPAVGAPLRGHRRVVGR